MVGNAVSIFGFLGLLKNADIRGKVGVLRLRKTFRCAKRFTSLRMTLLFRSELGGRVGQQTRIGGFR
jgi:hypothetical protein